MIKYIFTDIDGVWTDGGMIYMNDGQEGRVFNTSDSVGVIKAREAGLEVVVITGEDCKATHNRIKKLGIKKYHYGVTHKAELVVLQYRYEGIQWDEMAFIGDEVNDHELLGMVGLSGCPSSAPEYTKERCNYVTPTPGGKGAFRDFVMHVINHNDELRKKS